MRFFLKGRGVKDMWGYRVVGIQIARGAEAEKCNGEERNTEG